ncbi:MAG: asparagine synthase-related protein [Sphingobium sp.]
MSALAGLFHRDGQPLGQPMHARFSAALERHGGPCRTARGPDWLIGATAIGEDRRGGRIVVAADARIDNRDEIAAMLGLTQRAPLSTAEIVAALYRRFGTDCPAHILGDFAFLIWDEEERRLFGARDHFGVRPFYYHLAPQRFAAASSMGALHGIGVDDALDDTGMADFVAGAFADAEVTPYRHIRRLPPGHRMTVRGEDVRIDAYWRLEAAERAPSPSAAEEFRHLFTQAVRCRMEEKGTGVMLSGGLDSSSIAAVARHAHAAAPLPSFSLTFHDTPGWNEGGFIASMLASGDFRPHFLPSDHHDPLAAMDAMLREQDGPFLAYNHSVSRRLYHAARTEGVAVLLDGHGGDEVVSHGFGRLNELAIAGRWRALWREAGGVAALFGSSRWEVASPYLDHNRAVRAIRRRILGPVAATPSAIAGLSTDLVAPDLARRTHAEERQRAIRPSRSARQTERDRHLEMLRSPHQPHAFEVLDRAAAAAGVTARFPFYDRRLVEFCVAMPSHEKLAGGFPRAMLRNAMAGLMPEDVRLRRDKYDFSGQLAGGLARHAGRLAGMVRADAGGIGHFIDRQAAARVLERLNDPRERGTAHLFPAWRTAVLIHWLNQQSGALDASATQAA